VFFFSFSAHAAVIIDHNATDITSLTVDEIEQIKADLHIAYGLPMEVS
jgi:hypothetical protein